MELRRCICFQLRSWHLGHQDVKSSYANDQPLYGEFPLNVKQAVFNLLLECGNLCRSIPCTSDAENDIVTQNMDEKKVPWEDHLLERKTERDLKDIRRTAVAFANSVRPGHVATILIGECDDGSVPGITNADKMQRDIRQEFEKIYPDIVWRQKPYEKDGKTCLRIEIEFSGETPHFGDAAWIRKGNESVKASQEMLDKLIAIRSGVARELMKWIGKPITLSWAAGTHASMGINWSSKDFVIEDVTEFFATFKATDSAARRSEALRWLELSWDPGHERPRIYIMPK